MKEACPRILEISCPTRAAWPVMFTMGQSRADIKIV